jgi:protein O-GlcNAc transferase
VAPGYAEAWCNLGVIHKNQVRHQAAVGCSRLLRRLTTALHISCLLLCPPQLHQARQPGWCAGTCYCRVDLLQGRLAEAVDAYERALAAAPNFEIVRNNLAIALTELGTRTKLDGEA